MATIKETAETLLRSIKEEVGWIDKNRPLATQSQALELIPLVEAAERASRLLGCDC